MSIVDDILSWASPTTASGLNTQGTAFDAGGQLIGGMSHIQFGIQANQAAQFQAQQLRSNAGQQLASAQRAGENVDRQTAVVNSHALTVAAASGGASDPTVVNMMARNAGEGAYRKAVALYEGEDKARLMNMQADATSFQGKNTEANSIMVGGSQFLGARSTLMKGSAREGSLLSRYGADGPNIKPTGNAGWGAG